MSRDINEVNASGDLTAPLKLGGTGAEKEVLTVEAWQALSAASALTGEIRMWPLDTLPTSAEFLMCDGSEYDTVDYPALSALLGESSEGKFLVPDITFAKNSKGTDTGTSEAESVGTHGHVTADGGAHTPTGTSSSDGSHRHAQVNAGGSDVPVDLGNDTNVANDNSSNTAYAGTHNHTMTMDAVPDHTHVVNDHVGTNQPACTLINFIIKT